MGSRRAESTPVLPTAESPGSAVVPNTRQAPKMKGIHEQQHPTQNRPRVTCTLVVATKDPGKAEEPRWGRRLELLGDRMDGLQQLTGVRERRLPRSEREGGAGRRTCISSGGTEDREVLRSEPGLEAERVPGAFGYRWRLVGSSPGKAELRGRHTGLLG